MNWFIIALISALLSAAAAIIQKKILYHLSPLEFSFFVSALLVLLSLFVPLTRDVTGLPFSSVLIIVCKSTIGAVAFLLVMLSLKHNQISSALPLLGITPAVTALLALFLLGEGLIGWEWFGVGLMAAGAYLIEWKPNDRFPQPFNHIIRSRSYYYIFGAVLLFAFSSVFDRLLVGTRRIDPLIVLFYQHIVYLIVFFCILALRKKKFSSAFQLTIPQVSFIVAAAVLTFLYRITQLEATALAPVALVLSVKRSSILFATLLGGKLYSDERLKSKIVGAVCIVASGFIILRNVG